YQGDGWSGYTVDIRHSDGTVDSFFLEDMGLLPYSNGITNQVNFTLVEGAQCLEPQGTQA
ncbi:MAG: hypothetical protein Q8P12_07245, partial [bacterium]|nr:hypothetical protein [bacterium]